MAFTSTNEVQTQKPLKQKDALLTARIEKLNMEVKILQKAAKVSGDLIPVSAVAPFVGDFFQSTRNKFQELRRSLACALVGIDTPVQAYRIMDDSFNTALASLARGMAEKKILVNQTEIDPPITDLAWWLKDYKAPGIPSSITTPELAKYKEYIEVVKFTLLSLPVALSPRLVGKTSEEIEIILSGAIEIALLNLSGGGEKIKSQSHQKH